MAEQTGRLKLSTGFPGSIPVVPPYEFMNLPADRNDSDWNLIATRYQLNIEEKNALKNARCALPTQGKQP